MTKSLWTILFVLLFIPTISLAKTDPVLVAKFHQAQDAYAASDFNLTIRLCDEITKARGKKSPILQPLLIKALFETGDISRTKEEITDYISLSPDTSKVAYHDVQKIKTQVEQIIKTNEQNELRDYNLIVAEKELRAQYDMCRKFLVSYSDGKFATEVRSIQIKTRTKMEKLEEVSQGRFSNEEMSILANNLKTHMNDRQKLLDMLPRALIDKEPFSDYIKHPNDENHHVYLRSISDVKVSTDKIELLFVGEQYSEGYNRGMDCQCRVEFIFKPKEIEIFVGSYNRLIVTFPLVSQGNANEFGVFVDNCNFKTTKYHYFDSEETTAFLNDTKPWYRKDTFCFTLRPYYNKPIKDQIKLLVKTYAVYKKAKIILIDKEEYKKPTTTGYPWSNSYPELNPEIVDQILSLIAVK